MKKILLVIHNDNLLAKDSDNNFFEVAGLVIPKKDSLPAFYHPDSSFFKAACPEGTTHYAEVGDNGLVKLY